MRLLFPRAGLALALLAAAGVAAGAEPGAKKAGGCSGHGTNVEFYDTPSEAAVHAKKEQKLVFVLHVSGNFEEPRFT